MDRRPLPPSLPPVQLVAERIVATLERFLHIEAVSGIVLLAATATALIWANSHAAESYRALWHAPLAVSVGDLVFSRSLEFWINDGLMTLFFLVVGLEIRRELHEGVLATPRAAALPVAAALGGVAVPALIYVAWNMEPALRAGWAVPTATDIAFAVGVLALVGRFVPASVRILLLALAVIDDIVAVIIIAVFYSHGIEPSGLLTAAAGVLVALLLQRLGVRSAIPYIVPGVILWCGLLKGGIHPSLAGVVLGLLTPARSLDRGEAPIDTAARALTDFGERAHLRHDIWELAPPLRQLRDAERELLPPVTRVQMALHPWVAYGVMPLFALANAGVGLGEVDLADRASISVTAAILVALAVGKPAGILGASWLAVRTGWCALPTGVTWRSIALVGCLGGIGFTMAIFIASLAFADNRLLAAAKLGILLASALAATTGLLFSYLFVRTRGLVQSHAARTLSVTGRSP